MKISETKPFFEDIKPLVDEQVISQLETHGRYDQFLAKRHSDDPEIQKTGFLSLSSKLQVSLIQTDDLEDIFNDLLNHTQPLDLVRRQ